MAALIAYHPLWGSQYFAAGTTSLGHHPSYISGALPLERTVPARTLLHHPSLVSHIAPPERAVHIYLFVSALLERAAILLSPRQATRPYGASRTTVRFLEGWVCGGASTGRYSYPPCVLQHCSTGIRLPVWTLLWNRRLHGKLGLLRRPAN